MQGGLQSQANDSAGCCDRVRERRLAVPTRDREHRLAVPTRDREHRLGAEARRQSLSRRSPTAPPLHKGGPVAGRPYCLCLDSLCLPGKREYDSPGTGLAQRGSTAAPLVQRGDSMAGPCRGDCKARQMIQLGAVIGTGSTAWPSRHGTGSTAWERRLAVNPSVGVRRQLPLHKGGPVAGRPYCLCLGSLCLPGKREYDSPGTGLAQRGSAVWVQRHAGTPP